MIAKYFFQPILVTERTTCQCYNPGTDDETHPLKRGLDKHSPRAVARLARESVMKPERWQQIEQLYHSALERKGGQRVAFLDAACAGDDALRREVESLL